MKIRYLGHSCFKFEKNGYSVLVDPYQPDYVPGYRKLDETANLIISSHSHADHNGREGIKLVNSDECPFTIEKIDTYHDHHKGARRGMNSITVLDDGDMRVAHLGDLGFVPGSDLSRLYGVGILDAQNQQEMLDKLTGLDVLLVPVGGTFTIGPSEAALLVDILQPKRVIPMHYRGDNFGYPVLETVDKFLALVPNAVVMKPEYVE